MPRYEHVKRVFDGLMGQPFDPRLRDRLREFVVTDSVWGVEDFRLHFPATVVWVEPNDTKRRTRYQGKCVVYW
jgi:hypothetical protein